VRVGLTAAREQAAQRVAEVDVDDQVDDGVEGGVEVAEPDEDVEHRVVYRGRVGDQRARDVDGEEGQPAGDEAAHDDRQRLGDALLGAADVRVAGRQQALDEVRLGALGRLGAQGGLLVGLAASAERQASVGS
jgi:hypothetical protein